MLGQEVVISRGVSQAQNGARMLTARLCRIMSSQEKHGDFRPVHALGAPLISINCTGLDDDFVAFHPFLGIIIVLCPEVLYLIGNLSCCPIMQVFQWDCYKLWQKNRGVIERWSHSISSTINRMVAILGSCAVITTFSHRQSYQHRVPQ